MIVIDSIVKKQNKNDGNMVQGIERTSYNGEEEIWFLIKKYDLKLTNMYMGREKYLPSSEWNT